jgi:hypothetical protein
LTAAVEAGPWGIAPLGTYEGPWLSDRFQEVARRLIGSHVAARDQPIQNPAIVASRASGVDGRWPDPREMDGLQLALHFTVLHANPPWSEGTRGNAGWTTATSDNSTLHYWPVDVDEERVTLSSGVMVRSTVAGYTLKDGVTVPAPEELHLPHRVTLDPEVLAATRSVFVGEHDTTNARLAARLATTVGWLAQAWRNTDSVDVRQRIIMLKTGFEALTGESDSWRAAQALDELFRQIPLDAKHDRFAEHLVWKPSETASMTWTGQDGKPWPSTPVNHWFRSFSACRNEIVHEGRMSSATYNEATAYAGPYLFIAERVLREAVCVSLRAFGYHDLWKDFRIRLLAKAFRDTSAPGTPTGG